MCRATLLWRCRQVRRSQRVQQGVEAGEEQQRQHRAQSHHVVELGLQRTAPILSHIRPIFRAVVGRSILQTAGEVLETQAGTT